VLCLGFVNVVRIAGCRTTDNNDEAIAQKREERLINSAEEIINELEQGDFEESRNKLVQRNINKLAAMDNEAQIYMSASSFLALEHHLSSMYENFCKKYGVENMPTLKKVIKDLNKKGHGKSLMLLKKMGMSDKDIAKIYTDVNTIASQVNKAMETQIAIIRAETGATNKEFCEFLEETAVENELLDIKNIRPDIVAIIENTPL
jgi:hypothetical protein